MPGLDLALLGAPRIARDGEPVELDTRKAVALLAYLAMTKRAHTRDSLCALLWPEYDQEHARGALRRTLSALRKGLGGDYLETSRERVSLNAEAGVLLDVDRFRAALAAKDAASLADAVELYRGDFLAGFALRDSVNFDDWQYFEADSLRRELAEALERLVDVHAGAHEYDRAVLVARRWLALNPLHEPAHRRLIELYALNNERAAALRQYRECVRILDEELGVAPLEETTELYRAVRQNRLRPAEPAVRPPPPPTAAPQPAAPPALVGRESAWQALLQLYAEIEGDGRVVVVEGEAGIGKTRLAEEFLADVGARGAAALAARCYEEERELAYAPVAEVARAALARAKPSQDVRLEAARLLPEAGPGPAVPLDTPGAEMRFLESLTTLLGEAAAGSPPGVVFFDDVHWADEASLDFVTFAARRLGGRPMLLLLTWRTEEMPASHRLRRLIAETERGANGRILVLTRLVREDVEELTRTLAPGAAATERERIYGETEGVPLLVVEYCRALERGEEALPVGARQVLLTRLASVSEIASQVLAAGAVLGRSFDLDILREASGRTDEETVAALEELSARGLVREAGDGYDFRHERLRALVLEETSLARRRLLHRRAAAALARRLAASGPQAGAVARHYALAGQEEEAARYFERAGDHADSLFANAEAIGHFRAALAHGHPEPSRLHRTIGELETMVGDYDAALENYEAAAAAAAPEDLAAIDHQLGALHLRRGDWELAESHLGAALASAGDDRALGARIRTDLSLVAHHAGQPDRAAELAGEALELAESTGDRQALAQAHNLLGLLATSDSKLEAARKHLEESLALTRSVTDDEARAAALNNLALTLRAEGEFERAIDLTDEALRICSARGDVHREAALHNNMADLLRAAGRSEEGMQHLKQAVALFAEVGDDAVSEPEIWKLVRW